MANVGLITCYSSPDGAMAVSTPSYTYTPTNRPIVQSVSPRDVLVSIQYLDVRAVRASTQVVATKDVLVSTQYLDVRAVRGTIPSIGVVAGTAASSSPFAQYWG